MAWFKSIGKILGSGDVIEKGIDLIDDMHESDIELLEADTESKTKIINAKVNAKARLMEAYGPFKLAQRYLALMFGLTFVGTFWLCVVMTLLGKSIDDILELVESFKIAYIMGTIVGFYFMGGVAEGVIGKVKTGKVGG